MLHNFFPLFYHDVWFTILGEQPLHVFFGLGILCLSPFHEGYVLAERHYVYTRETTHGRISTPVFL